MKNLVIYYSYGGNTKQIATDLAEKNGADLLEVIDVKKPGKIRAYVLGCFAAMRMKASAIRPISTDLSVYDIITILSPVWAGHSVPPINAVFELLPPNKKIEILLVSASGKSDVKEKIEAVLLRKNCELVKYEDVKA